MDSILNVILTDMHPLYMIEGKGLKQMMANFSPQYDLPS